MFLRNKTVLVACDMGFGKTAAALYAISKLKKQGKLGKVLIVAPKFVAANVWPEELKSWDFCDDLNFLTLTGLSSTRKKLAIREETDILIINREQLPWLYEINGNRLPYQTLIYDESSRLKSGKAKTKERVVSDTCTCELNPFEMIGVKCIIDQESEIKCKNEELNLRTIPSNITEFGVLEATLDNFEYKMLLSGTPAPQSEEDLWGQMKILDGGERLHVKKYKFLKEYFVRTGFKYTPKTGALQKIMDKVKDIMFSMKTEDVVDMPQMVITDVKVTLPEKVMAQYRKFKKELVLELGDLSDDVLAANSAVLTGKLLQIANGSVYRDTGTGERETIKIHTGKIEALKELVDQANGEPVLIVYLFEFDRDTIMKNIKGAVDFTKDEKNYKKWNDGEIPVMLIHPGSAGHGLNLQHGGNKMIFYGLTWSLEQYQQVIKRLHRPGQEKTVYVWRILAEKTIDIRVADVLVSKADIQDLILEAVAI